MENSLFCAYLKIGTIVSGLTTIIMIFGPIRNIWEERHKLPLWEVPFAIITMALAALTMWIFGLILWPLLALQWIRLIFYAWIATR